MVEFLSVIGPAVGQLLLAAFTGGLLVKVLDKFLPSSDKRMDDSAGMRKELWDRLEDVEDTSRAMQKDLDGWKDKYYELQSEYHKVVAENHLIRAENHQLLSKLSAMNLQIQRLSNKMDEHEVDRTSGPTQAGGEQA
jgi:regulator of replication initiation timing